MAKKKTKLLVLAHEGTALARVTEGAGFGVASYESLAGDGVALQDGEPDLLLGPLCEGLVIGDRQATVRLRDRLARLAAGARDVLGLVPADGDARVTSSCSGRFDQDQAPCSLCVLNQWSRLLGHDSSFGRSLSIRDLDGAAPAVLAEGRALRSLLGSRPPRFHFVWRGQPGQEQDELVPLAEVRTTGEVLAARVSSPSGSMLLLNLPVQDLDETALELLARVMAESRPSRPAPAFSAREKSPEDLLSLQETAAYLRITTGTLRNWVSQERLPHVRDRGLLLFRWKDLQAWIDSHTMGPDQEDEPEIHTFPWDEEERDR